MAGTYHGIHVTASGTYADPGTQGDTCVEILYQVCNKT
jgi:hypothetical protein